jgi:hypothetical protein
MELQETIEAFNRSTPGERTDAHRRLHTRQLGLIHICGRGKRNFSVEEAVAGRQVSCEVRKIRR